MWRKDLLQDLEVSHQYVAALGKEGTVHHALPLPPDLHLPPSAETWALLH